MSFREMEAVEGGLSDSFVCSVALGGWGLMMGAAIGVLTLGGGLIFGAAYMLATGLFCDYYGNKR